MKHLLAWGSICILAASPVQAADTIVQLKQVHLCCPGCTKGVNKAVSTVPGAAAKSDRDAATVTITGPDQATVQKAVDALVGAGYFGVSSDPAIKVINVCGVDPGKTRLLKIKSAHLCCAKCATAVNE